MDGARGPGSAFVSSSAVDCASRAAEAAASRAQVTIGAVEGIGPMQDAVELLRAVWGADRREPPVRRDMMRALAHAGNFVAAASAGDDLVGVIVGFLGRNAGELVLHSHILGVVEAMQGRGVGFALKQHQRWWSLARGLEHVTWTFDPLVRRNASFNLHRLGGRIVAYHTNFYGPMDDGINASDESDRCVVWWPLLDDDVALAAEGHHHEPTGDPPPGRTVVLEPDGGGWPREGRARAADGPPSLAAWVPGDIVAMRREDPGKALAWRRAFREVLSGALAGGRRITGITRSGWYVLERDGTRPT